MKLDTQRDPTITVGRGGRDTFLVRAVDRLQGMWVIGRALKLWRSTAGVLKYSTATAAVLVLAATVVLLSTSGHRLLSVLTGTVQQPAASVAPAPASQLPYGVTTVHADTQLLNDFRDTNIHWLRYQIFGSNINWTQLDSDVVTLNKANIHIDFSIHCLSGSCFTNPQIPPASAYASLAAKLAARYNGKGTNGAFIDAYEIGNEEFDAISPSAYPAYLKAGCMAVKQYSPTSLCGMYGTFTPNLSHYTAVVSSIFHAGDGQYMDFMNFHYYVHGNDPANPGNGLPSYDQVWQSYQSVAKANGFPNMPIWVTETGWPTAAVSCCHAVSPAAQSQYLTYVMDHSRNSKIVTRVFWFTMDYGDQGDSLDRTSTGRLPAFFTYQKYVAQYPTWGTSTSPAAPTVSLTASPASVASGTGSTLAWNSTNATSCTASGAWTGAKPTSGSASTSALSASKVYTLNCSGSGGTVSAAASVTVGTATAGPTVILTAIPTSVASGASSTLTWSSTNATSCTASGSWSGAKPVSGTGPTSPLTASAVYTLSCSGANGSASASASVSVSGTPVPSGGITDTFHRSNQAGWGTSTSGQKWTLDGATSSSFSISGNAGKIHGNGASTATIGGSTAQSNVAFSGSLESFNGTRLGVIARYKDDNNWYMAYYDGSTFAILKRDHGNYTTLKSKSFTAQANTAYSIRFQVSSSSLSAKIWQTSGSEPSVWTLQATDGTFASGTAGVRAGLANNATASVFSFSL